MTEGSVRYVRDVEIASGRDQAVIFVKSLEGRILCLHGVDSGHCGKSSEGQQLRSGRTEVWLCT